MPRRGCFLFHSAALTLLLSLLHATDASSPTGQPSGQPSLRPTEQSYYYYYYEDYGEAPKNHTPSPAPSLMPSQQQPSVGAIVGIVLLGASCALAFTVYIFMRKPPWLPCFRVTVQPVPAVASVAATMELTPLDSDEGIASALGATYVIPTAVKVVTKPTRQAASAIKRSVSPWPPE
jgi:hypothetical protein